jgi:SNF2-related domain
LILFGMQNRTSGLYLAAITRIRWLMLPHHCGAEHSHTSMKGNAFLWVHLGNRASAFAAQLRLSTRSHTVHRRLILVTAQHVPLNASPKPIGSSWFCLACGTHRILSFAGSCYGLQVIEIVCCKMTELQRTVYNHFLESNAALRLLNGKAAARVLSAITSLKKLCNHPKLIYDTMHSTAKKDGAEGFEAGGAGLHPSCLSVLCAGHL